MKSKYKGFRSSYEGFFVPKNPDKYKGDTKNIVYRSRLEYRFYSYFDKHPAILKWGSEERDMVVKYIHPMDNKYHRYFIDAWVKIQTKSGEIKEYLIEIKPFAFTTPPVVPARKTKSFREAVARWLINAAKWEAARKFAKQKGIEFIIMTEKDL